MSKSKEELKEYNIHTVNQTSLYIFELTCPECNKYMQLKFDSYWDVGNICDCGYKWEIEIFAKGDKK